MDTKRILRFLQDIAANNNREWFLDHKSEYQACKQEFEAGVAALILEISKFDAEVSHLTPKDCCFRFYRDVRFSPDKSPYKRHFGAYICAHGKKSLRGGYYIHLQPGRCLLSCGAYWLPTNILTSCRNEIMANIDEWRKCVENGRFISYFGYPNAGKWAEDNIDPKGFGIESLKTIPKGFPRDYEFADYLRMKDYATWRLVPDDYFQGDGWLKDAVKYLKVAKPMMDFMNAVIDDYE